MDRNFEVIETFIHHNRGLFIFARHLGDDHDFVVTEGSMFGDLPVYLYENIKLTDDNDNPRQDVFVFRPVPMDRHFDKSFKKGQLVTLTT